MANDESTDWMGVLKQARDELRVKMHLASMDAREHFTALDKQVDELEAEYGPKAKAAVHVLDETGRDVARDLKAGFEKLRASLAGDGPE